MKLFIILIYSLYSYTAIFQSNWTAAESAAEWIIWSVCIFFLSCWWDFWYSLNLYVSLLFDILFQWNRNNVLSHMLWFFSFNHIDKQKILFQILTFYLKILWNQFCLFLFEWSLYFLFCKKQHVIWQLHVLIFWFLIIFTQIFLFFIIVFIC